MRYLIYGNVTERPGCGFNVEPNGTCRNSRFGCKCKQRCVINKYCEDRPIKQHSYHITYIWIQSDRIFIFCNDYAVRSLFEYNLIVFFFEQQSITVASISYGNPSRTASRKLGFAGNVAL